MPKLLKRIYRQKHLHFITCSCYRRLPLLGTAQARHLFPTKKQGARKPPPRWTLREAAPYNG